MKLASEASVFEALQVGSISMIETATAEALHAATLELSTMLLEPTFDAGTYTEEFFIHAMLRGGECYRANLALNHGFVTGSPVVKSAATYAGLADGTVLEATEYKFNAEKGEVIILSTTNYEGMYISVAYSAGFEADDVDDELFANVPEWLQVVATKVGAAALLEVAPDLTGNSNGDTGRDPEKLRKSAFRMLETKIRYFPSPIRPM